MSLDLSLGEVQALAVKAARGAGRSFGIAEEAGFAVRWLCSRGYDGVAALAALLQMGPDVECPLLQAAGLSDRGGGDLGVAVPAPLLVVPFLASLAGSEDMVIRIGAVATLRLGVDGGLTGPDPGAAVAEVRFWMDAPKKRAFTMAKRACVTAHDLETLNTFAARTYAPATDESRARGAGADA